MNDIKKQGTYFPQLDIIRFIAAFMIIVLHIYESWCGSFGEIPFFSTGKPNGVTIVGKYIETFIETFRLGIDIFFLISGFLITYLLLQEKEKTGSINIKKFFIRRVLRIWPVYYLIIAVAPFLVYWLNVPAPDYMPNLLFINNFHTISTHVWAFPFDHYWSICIEEHFYLVWPLIIFLVPKPKLLYVLYSMLTLSVTYRIWVAYNTPNPQLILYLSTFCRMDVLIIGAIIAYYYCKKPFIIKVSGGIRLAVYSILIVAMFIDHGFHNPLFEVMKKYFYIGLAGFAILNYNFNPGARFQLKNNKFIHYLGKISYGIYMYGSVIMYIMLKKIFIPFHITNIYLFIFLNIVVPIATAAISYKYFETFFLKLKRSLETIKTGIKKD